MSIKTADLIKKFQYALDNKFGYILNTTHTAWTESLQNQKIKSMVDQFGANWRDSAAAKNNSGYTAAMYGGQWIGHWVTDCSGLFAWAFKELGGYMYHGSNTMWNKYCTAKGKLNNGKRADGQPLKPGTAVFVLKGTSNRSHVGLYIGNNTVIEASGTKVGVITTKITNTKWCEWGELKGVDYSTASTNTNTNSGSNIKPAKGTAVVNAPKVAFRALPSTKGTVLERLDEGTIVNIVTDDTWTQVSYEGKTGYMMTEFLNKG